MTTTAYAAFIPAFTEAANLAPIDGPTQWAWWSRGLTDAERQQIENGGAEAGRKEGECLAQLRREIGGRSDDE